MASCPVEQMDLVERISLREAFMLWAILSLAGWRLILMLMML